MYGWRNFYKQFTTFEEGWTWLLANLLFVKQTSEAALKLYTPPPDEELRQVVTNALRTLADPQDSAIRYHLDRSSLACQTASRFRFGWTKKDRDPFKFKVALPASLADKAYFGVMVGKLAADGWTEQDEEFHLFLGASGGYIKSTKRSRAS